MNLSASFRAFFRSESASAILVFLAAAIAFLSANSPLGSLYTHLRELPIGLPVVGSKTLEHWVADGFMTLFFLLVGLEIKRERIAGELVDTQKALLTVFAAVGGMLCPAIVYALFNPTGLGARGWGIPMATDIAFALGALSLLGKRVPTNLKVFLTALAVVDDLGAIVVIALFYTVTLNWVLLGCAFLTWLITLGVARLNVRTLWPYGILGFVLWLLILKSGLHATIAGVLLAFAIPLRVSGHSEMSLKELDRVSLFHRLEHHLAPWVGYLILPIFAFFNAGVKVGGAGFGPIPIGIFLGLLLGKPIGILGFSWLALRLRWARLPDGVRWVHLLGAGCLAGIGFTMALFIGYLAFGPSAELEEAKRAIIIASVASAIVGMGILRFGVSDKR